MKELICVGVWPVAHDRDALLGQLERGGLGLRAVGQSTRSRTASTLGNSPYQLQEDIHPNYWGQLALRNCMRQAYSGGSPRGGTCSIAAGLDAQGEPQMTLQ